MAFFKFRSRGPQANEGRNAGIAAAPAESIETMRRRARHRLLGAAILMLVGVIGFPLLFDTQPRPVAVDIPIEIPDRAKVAPLAVPATAKSDAQGAGSRVAQAPSAGSMITEGPDGSEVQPGRAPAMVPAEPRPDPVPASRAERKPEPKAEHKSESRPETKPETKPKAEARHESKPEPAAKPATATKPPTADDGARARALLDGQGAAASRQAAAAAPAPAAAAAAESSSRFVVQVGAFADEAKAREVRQKLERAGLKTYMNVAKTADGDRTRVRVGPFASRAEADQAAGKVKGLSLPAAVLGL